MLLKSLYRNAFFQFSNAAQTTAQSADLSAYHKSQTGTMKSLLIKVSKTDEYKGSISKVDAHLNSNSEPHRAFSLFVFDKKGRLLLQQRADVKITFPGYWTNTCCSHPIHKNDQRKAYKCYGVRLASVIRLNYEVGIRLVGPEAVFPVQKVYYSAKYDEQWGENEVDYVLFARLPEIFEKKREIKFNPNEVKAVTWVERDKVREFLSEKEAKGEKTTPWMKKILDYKLLQWWEDFEKNKLKGDLKKTVDLMA